MRDEEKSFQAFLHEIVTADVCSRQNDHTQFQLFSSVDAGLHDEVGQ